MRTKFAGLILMVAALVICGVAQSSGSKKNAVLAGTAKTSASQGDASTPASTKEIDIPYTRFVLQNGLTVIVHEDHKAPIVAVNMWYHVGSKNEKTGEDGVRAPFRAPDVWRQRASPGRYIDTMEKIGATDLNGTTNHGPHQLFRGRANFGAGFDVCGWNRTGWGICWARLTRRRSLCSAGWCRTKNGRAKISLTE